MYNTTNQTIVPVGGLAYYVTPPSDIFTAINQPLRTIVFVSFMIIFSILFAVIWVEVGGLSADKVSQQLIDSGMQIPGFRRRSSSISILLGRYIPAVTVIGGFFVGLIAGAAQIVGVFGSGMGILLTVDILMNYYQTLMREQIEEVYPALSRFLQV
jgi:preprotein translocase subunit SecY